MWNPKGWKHGTERVLGGTCSTSALPLEPMRSLSWKCLQHIRLIPLRMAAEGRWKATRHSRKNVTFLSDILVCFKGKENRREVGPFYFLVFCAVHIETRYWSWPCLNTLYLMQDSKLDQLLHKYQQILSRYFPPSSKSQHLHWTQTHNHLHVVLHLQNQPEVASSALPKQGTSQHPMGTSVGKYIFSLFLWLWREVRPYSNDGVTWKVIL